MERKFKSYMVDIRGLSRKEAKEKRKRAYREFMLLSLIHISEPTRP